MHTVEELTKNANILFPETHVGRLASKSMDFLRRKHTPANKTAFTLQGSFLSGAGLTTALGVREGHVSPGSRRVCPRKPRGLIGLGFAKLAKAN